MNKDILFTPLKLGSLTLKNRFVQTPVEVGMADFDGGPTELLTDYYLKRVRGGVGLICTGICRVNNIHGVSSPRQLSLVHNRSIPAFKTMTELIHKEGGKIVVQLHHPGRQTYSALVGNWPLVEFCSRIIPGFKKVFTPLVRGNSLFQDWIYTPRVVSASAIPCSHVGQKTRALKTGEVKTLVRQFVAAAVRAQKAGFDGVELHASHGYLIQQFLSPYSNKRKDEYGGSFENRMRFIAEIIQGIRGKCGSGYPLLVRLTVDEFIPEDRDERGITLDAGIRIARELESLGVDGLDISSASYEQMNKWLETVSYEPGWRKHLAAEIKKNVTIPVIAANMIRSAEQAANQIEEGVQDGIGLGRPLLADPELPDKIRRGREDEIRRCISCCQCFESLNRNAWFGEPLRCSLNPTLAVRSADLPAGKGKVVVVGGGPAGLQAALTLSDRGFDVVLFEKNSELGGQIRLADKAPDKVNTAWSVDYYRRMAEQRNITVHLGRKADTDLIRREHPDAVFLATGALPLTPSIPGASLKNVYCYDEILSGRRLPDNGEHVAVIGSGMTGLETAEYLVSRKMKVSVIEMAGEIAPDAYFQHKSEAIESLQESGTEFISSAKLSKIEPEGIILENMKDGSVFDYPVDSVVLALGSRPNNPLEEELKETSAFPVHVIGDAGGIGKIADAVQQAYTRASRMSIPK